MTLYLHNISQISFCLETLAQLNEIKIFQIVACKQNTKSLV